MSNVLNKIIGVSEMEEIKIILTNRVMEQVPESVFQIQEYMLGALDIQNTLETSVGGISSKDFEQLLHPVFEQDEWKLITLGGK